MSFGLFVSALNIPGFAHSAALLTRTHLGCPHFSSRLLRVSGHLLLSSLANTTGNSVTQGKPTKCASGSETSVRYNLCASRLPPARFPTASTPFTIPFRSLPSRTTRPFHTSTSLPLPSDMDSKSDARVKRKQPPTTSVNDRPTKHRKAPPAHEADEFLEADSSPRSGAANGADGYSDEDLPVLGKVAAIAETVEWQATIEKVVKNVVSIVSCSWVYMEVAGTGFDYGSSISVKLAHLTRTLQCRVRQLGS